MRGFSADWLALREPADEAARSAEVARFVIDGLPGRAPTRIVDLGSGTGSNVRSLSALMPQRQEWRLVDNDEALLAVARTNVPVPVETHVADLQELDAALVAGRDLVTASALLDLVSESWLARFVQHCRNAGAAVLVVLNYDGRIECSPQDADDELVRRLVNLHQRTDKGFGAALGPDSGLRAEALLREAGYDVRRERSDWVLGPGQTDLQRAVIAGWAGAAIEMSASDAARIRAWEDRRLAHVNAGDSRLVVGHDDVGAVSQT